MHTQHQETADTNHQRLLQNYHDRSLSITRQLDLQHKEKTIKRNNHLSDIKRKYIKKVLQLEEQQKNLTRLHKRDERHKQDILARQEQSQARLEQHNRDKH